MKWDRSKRRMQTDQLICNVFQIPELSKFAPSLLTHHRHPHLMPIAPLSISADDSDGPNKNTKRSTLIYYATPSKSCISAVSVCIARNQ
ncbi:hypothetical protein K503DRAFT_777961 [Rhizopogon vinicolor AM-OR11-026]|uniref:Uncharacterized protein n=1 Tax=Rhizopogon vinicolor AM-OR11-026 TaxID=1314800 RepID=A0A1B7ME93_9AGAM|nr:hypothetical protein K503DRAFT_777961 [Rhizopogon vinicolor AM-OR11-026]